MVGCFCQNGLDIFQTFSKSVCLFGCWLAVWSKVVDDVVAGMSRSETTMEPPPEDTVPSEQPDGFSLKIFFFDQKKECVTWFNKNLSVPSYSCLAIVVDLWILKNIWDTMSIYQSTPWWTFFFSMARYELEAGTAHKHDDLPKRVTSGASLQAWKFLHFLP